MRKKPVDRVKSADEARQLAMRWQSKLPDTTMSWGEVAEWGLYFTELGERFNLMEEFKENGIL